MLADKYVFGVNLPRHPAEKRMANCRLNLSNDANRNICSRAPCQIETKTETECFGQPGKSRSLFLTTDCKQSHPLRTITMNSSFYLAIATLCFAQMACGQQPTRTTTDNTTLVIEGRVINVFQSASANQNVLVQIKVQKSEAMRLDNLERSTRFPAPGEYLYVHVDSSISSTNRGNRETSQLPRPDTYIRAMLQSGNHQDWAGVSQDWYQEIGRDSGPVTTNDSRSILGITTERVSLTKFHALKVTAVEAESPAAKAGIEVGDILLSANDVDLSRPEQLVEQVQKSDGLLKLMVQDVRAGRVVPVEVKWDSAMKAERASSEFGCNYSSRVYRWKSGFESCHCRRRKSRSAGGYRAGPDYLDSRRKSAAKTRKPCFRGTPSQRHSCLGRRRTKNSCRANGSSRFALSVEIRSCLCREGLLFPTLSGRYGVRLPRLWTLIRSLLRG